MVIVLVILLLVVFVAFWFIGGTNNVKRKVLKVDEAKSSIEIYLIKRWETITQSAKICKEYKGYEKELFENMHKPAKGGSLEDVNSTLSEQNKAVNNLLALGEAFPELKSSELYAKLQDQLSEENADIAAAKRCLNANITNVNNLVVSFPSSIFCSMAGVSKMSYIEEEVDDRKVLNIEL